MYDAENKKHIVRMENFFEFRSHLCLVFELLDINIYEYLKQNQVANGESQNDCQLTSGIVHRVTRRGDRKIFVTNS